MKHVSCYKCGTVLVEGPGEPDPCGICLVCLKAGKFKDEREIRARHRRRIRAAVDGKPKPIEIGPDEDVFRGFP